MTLNILVKNGEFQFEKTLEKMNWDTAKFESELEVYAKTQPPQMQAHLLKEYNKFMTECGWPMELVVVGEYNGVKVRIPKVKPKPKLPITPQITPEIPIKPEIKPETTPETDVAEVAAQVETQKEEVPETVPQVDTTPTVELTTEIVAKEQPQEPVKTKTNNAFPSTTAYFTFPDANLFKKLYEAMCVLVGEINWKITKDSVVMRQMDPSRVAMIDLEIKKEDFEEFDVAVPGFCAFNAEEVKKIVFAKPFKKDTRIGVKIDGVTNKVTFIIKDNRIRERTFFILEAEQEDIPTPKITFNAKYKVISKQVAEDIDELVNISDHMTLIGTNEMLRMTAEGDTAKGDTIYNQGDETLLDIEVKEKCKAVYSLTYLKDIIKPLPVLGELTIIEFATDMPIKITNLTKFGELKFFIAPRIETD